ncbi:MAG: hypothetical protein IPG12_03400 [Saprospiraceae bacterium]|nr:hypothetical protein [Saprospiraceae bacterium]
MPSVSTQKNPVVKYNLPGVYDVRLTVYGSRFNHSITKKAYITIDSLPVAQFANSIDVGKLTSQINPDMLNHMFGFLVITLQVRIQIQVIIIQKELMKLNMLRLMFVVQILR